MVTADYIVNGLIQRGLPEHVARGFAINMQDESGLNPGINEIAPLVPGSRGGFGLYQLTGPRRRAYEAFAAQRGVDVAEPDAQLDFLMTELKGPEARAAKSILGAKDVSEAAAAIARDFLRPSPENLQKRLARYGGQGGMQMQPTVSTQGGAQGASPMQDESEPKWKNKDLWANLAIAFNSMRMRPDAGLAQVMRSGIERRASERKASQSRNKTADWLESQGAVDLAAGVRGGAVPAQVALQMAMQKPKDSSTALQKNYEYALAQGMTPEQARQWVSSGTTVNVGGDGATPFQEQVDKKFAERYLDWKTSGAADTSQQVAQISSVLSKLEAGEELTGPLIGAISNVGLGAIFTPEAQDAKERVESVVQRSLRETLGAQFTEKEGQRLIERSYNPSLRPEQNAARLRALYQTLAAADAAKRAMIEYVETNGTLAGYSGPSIPNATDIEKAMDQAVPFGQAPSGSDLSDEDLLKKYGG